MSTLPIKPPAFNEYREKPWGHECIFTPPDVRRVGKLLFVKARHKLSLQFHEIKEETITLYQGNALLWYGTSQANVQPYVMEEGTGYTIYPGAVHRLEAIEDSYFFEVSSPETGRTARLQDDYDRTDEVR